jgi:myosin heavy subunit
MPFTIDDVRDLVRILEEKPEWRAELRRLMLSDDLAALREQIEESRLASERRIDRINEEIAELRVATERHTEQLAGHTAEIAELRAATERHTAEIAELRAATERHTEQLAGHTAEIAELRAATERHTAEIAELRAATERHTEQLAGHTAEIAELRAATERHTHSIRELSIDVSDLKGIGLEERYRRMAPAYFSRLIRRARVMRQDQFTALVDQAVTDGVLSTNEASDLLWVDLVVSGRRQDDGHEVFLVVEVSWTVGVKDVERAAKRAALFGRIRPPVLAVAAGKFVSEDVAIRARGENVWVFLDGRGTPPDRTEIGPY